MLAAFQRATKSTEEYLRASARSWVATPETSNASDDDTLKNKRPISDIDLQTFDPRWIEIPLCDEDEQPSPRGVLQFRKGSESDGGYSQAGDSMPYPSGSSLRRRRNSSSSTNSSDQNTSFLSPPSLPCDSNLFSQWESDALGRNDNDTTTNASAKTHQGQQNVLDKGMAYSTPLQSTPLASSKGDFVMEGFSPLKVSCTSPTYSVSLSRSQNVSTQTPKDCDEFASTRTALQHQVADALNALDLTRKQADALRDRLRTYTSSMKQQADDLRASSRSLSHALDKAKEYKVHWKNESALKEEAKRKVEELDLNVKSLQKTLNQRDSEMRMFHQGIDILNTLLGVGISESADPNDKLTCTSKAIKRLLELVEKLQTEAAVSSIVSMVELKESVRKFEEEKQSWISFTKANEQSVSDKISRLQNENEMLQAKLDRVQQSSVELQNRLSQANCDRTNKDTELDQSQRLITSLQATLRATEGKLLKSMREFKKETLEKDDLRVGFMQKQLVLEKEKKVAEDKFAKLTRILEYKKTNVRNQMTSYEPPFDVELQRHVAIQTSQHSTQTSDNVAESDCSDAETASLQREIGDLKWSLWHMKRDFSDAEDDFLRIRNDLKQLKWTCHCQEVTIQTVRAENKALKTSIAKLKQAKENQDYDAAHANQWVDTNTDTEQRTPSVSLNESDCEQAGLQTTSNEKCSSAGEVISTLSICSDETPNVQSSMLSSVSTEAELKQDTYESRTLAPIYNDEKIIVNTAAITLQNENHGTAYIESDDSRSSSVRKRVAKSRKYRYPIWRQENPDNQFSSERVIEDNSSTDSDDVFSLDDMQLLRNRYATPSQSSKNSRHNSSVSRISIKDTRRLGIPMSEKEFNKLMGSMNSPSFSPRQDAFADASLYDDGYSSSIADALESRPRSRQLHRTLLGYDIDSISSESDEPTQTQPEKESLEPCFVTYGGLTFDATKFGMVEMRQFMCDLGIAHSAEEMHKFMEFLAEKVHELDSDPVWRGSHNLGKSEDWLSLKCLF